MHRCNEKSMICTMLQQSQNRRKYPCDSFWKVGSHKKNMHYLILLLHSLSSPTVFFVKHLEVRNNWCCTNDGYYYYTTHTPMIVHASKKLQKVQQCEFQSLSLNLVLSISSPLLSIAECSRVVLTCTGCITVLPIDWLINWLL